MIRTDRLFSRLVLVGALAAALAAGGCGRKGPLDAPPGGAAAVETSQGGSGQVTQSGLQPTQQNTQNGVVDRGGVSTLPRVRGEDKRIPLDVLLN